jgi:hypothetical protein
MSLKWFAVIFLATMSYANSYLVSFDEHSLGIYTSKMTYTDFGRDSSKPNFKHAEIVQEDFGNHSLRLLYPKGCIGTSKENGCAIQMRYKIKEPKDSLWLSYKVFFEDGFDFVKGGKLPGFCGGKCNTGGHKNNFGDGWSARIMWRENGTAEQYIYHADQKDKYGESFKWTFNEGPVLFKTSQWHLIVMHLKMNSIDKQGNSQFDGSIKCWLDGKLVLNHNNIRFRHFNNIHIDQFYFSTFHGGNNKSWAPQKNSYCRFDHFIISNDSISVAP